MKVGSKECTISTPEPGTCRTLSKGWTTVRSQSFRLLCRLCSHCKRTAAGLEWRLPLLDDVVRVRFRVISLALPKRDYRVHWCQNERIFRKKHSLFGSRRSKQDTVVGTHISTWLRWGCAFCLFVWLVGWLGFFFFLNIMDFSKYNQKKKKTITCSGKML